MEAVRNRNRLPVFQPDSWPSEHTLLDVPPCRYSHLPPTPTEITSPWMKMTQVLLSSPVPRHRRELPPQTQNAASVPARSGDLPLQQPAQTHTRLHPVIQGVALVGFWYGSLLLNVSTPLPLPCFDFGQKVVDTSKLRNSPDLLGKPRIGEDLLLTPM